MIIYCVYFTDEHGCVSEDYGHKYFLNKQTAEKYYNEHNTKKIKDHYVTLVDLELIED